jgi:hypothetical protein
MKRPLTGILLTRPPRQKVELGNIVVDPKK